MTKAEHNRRCAESLAAAQVAIESARQWMTTATDDHRKGASGRQALASDLIMTVHTVAGVLEHLAAAMLAHIAADAEQSKAADVEKSDDGKDQ